MISVDFVRWRPYFIHTSGQQLAKTTTLRLALFPPRAALSLLAALLALALASGADAAVKRKATTGYKPPYAAIVIDAADGRVVHAEDADAMRHPASLTKLMTLYLVFEALDAGRLAPATALRVSAHAEAQSPTKLGLAAGDAIAVRDVILGLVTKSANDAAVVVAEALAGSEEKFAQRMTAKARRLGMTRTTYQNANGLPDPDQVTTARDQARLARALLRDFPHHYHYFATSAFTYAGVTHANHNRFMGWYEGADGFKTGFIRASGFNLVASARRGERRLIGVVMGGTSAGARDQRMGEILDAAFASRPVLPPTRRADVPAPDAPQAQGSAIVAAIVPAAANGSWGVQVGAFADAAQARRAAEQAKRLAPTPLAPGAIDLAAGFGKHALVRARLVGLSAEQARDACRALKQKKHGCIPL